MNDQIEQNEMNSQRRKALLTAMASSIGQATTEVVIDAYSLGYQAAEENAADMAKAGIQPAGPDKPSIAPEDMQDGKRYRAIFEGEYHAPVPGFESETYGAIDLLSAGELDDDQLRSATRIEEIGGEQ